MYYFIINPKARSGAGLSLWNKAQQILDFEHVEYKAFFTQYPGHGTTLSNNICQVLNKHDTLIALGGDGTLGEVLDGIIDPENTTFAYIPTGSGNDFAKGMMIYRDIEKAIHAILHPVKIDKLDICTCKTSKTTHSFAISSGIGYDAGVCYEVQISPLKKVLNFLKLGKLTYAIIALKQLLSFKPFQLKMTLDHDKTVTYHNVYFAAAMNQQYEGGGFRFCPDAKPGDGILDLVIAHDMSKIKVLFVLPIAYFGKHTKIKGIHILRCKDAVFQTDREVPVHYDGEPACMASSAALSVGTKQIQVIVR